MADQRQSGAPARSGPSVRNQELDRILSAALTLMLRQGLRGTTYDEVVTASGLPGDIFQRQVTDHEELVLKILERVEEEVIGAIVSEVAKAPATADGKLGGFLETMTKAPPSRISLMVFLINASTEYGSTEGRIGTRVGRLYGHLYRTVEGILQFGSLRGSFRTDLPTRELSAVFVAMLTGIVLEARRMSGELETLQLDRAIRLLLLRGMEDRIAIERVLSGYVIPGFHP